MSSARAWLAAVAAAARRDWIRRWRDPLAIALWVGIPLVIGGLIVLAMGGRSGAAPRAKVLVASHDDGLLAKLLVQALSSEQAGVIDAESVDEAEGRARMLEGDATALLIVPAGFSDAVWNEWPTRLELVTNPSQRILPGVVEEALSILGEAVFYAHRVLGDDLRSVMNASISGAELEVARSAVEMRREMERIGRYVFPPAIEVTASVRGGAEPAPARGLAGFFLPSMLMMALLFMAEGLADDVWREKTTGALRRIVSSPRGAAPSLLGKLLAGWALMLCVATLACGLAALAWEVPLGRAALAAVWCACSGAVFLALLTVLKLFASSARAAGVLGNLVIFPVMMLGGSFMPFEVMPDWLVRIGRWTPNGWAVTQLDELLFGEVQLAALTLSFVCAAAAVALLTWLGARRLGGAFARRER